LTNSFTQHILIAVGETAHAGHNSQDVEVLAVDQQLGQVSDGVGGTGGLVEDVSSDISAACLSSNSKSGIIDATEVACTTGLMLQV
jgi:hypothetical protein